MAAISDRGVNLRNVKVDSSSGKNVRDTTQLKGEAKDSLAGAGSNTTEQYNNSPTISGPYGGMNKSK